MSEWYAASGCCTMRVAFCALLSARCALRVARSPLRLWPPLHSPNCACVMFEMPSVSMPVITATNIMVLYTIAARRVGAGGGGGSGWWGWEWVELMGC